MKSLESLRVPVLVLALLLAAAAGWWLVDRSARSLPTIDLGGGAAVGGRVGPESGEDIPTLRVAVAAMTSPEVMRSSYEGLLSLVAEALGRRLLLVQRKTYAEVNAMLEREELDLAFVCSGPYVEGHARFGLELLVVPVVRGETVYRAYIVAHREGGIDSFDDLRGRTFAFTDVLSNTGSLVPRHLLAQRQETPASFFEQTFYTHSHDNSIRAVCEHLADGASVDSLIWDFVNEANPDLTACAKVVEASSPFGIPPVVVNPALEAETKNRLREAFLTLHESLAAEPLLRKLRIDRFVVGEDSAYDSIRAMRRSSAERAAT